MTELPCELCQSSECCNILIKCCQLFICMACRQKIDKLGQCPSCQKTLVPKKWYQTDQRLFQTLSDFYKSKPLECGRCDLTQNIEYCEDCQQNFCDSCMQQIHSVGLYQAHKRLPLTDTKKILEHKKNSNKDQICLDHKQKKQFICECNNFPMCNVCLKIHRESCVKKHRQFSQFKKQYFALMLQKLEHIGRYKEYLSKSQGQYTEHFNKQKFIYRQCAEYVKSTFDNFAKLIQFKKNEIKLQLEQYWEECQQIYQRNQAHVKLAMSQFDDFAMLIQRFSEKAIGLDYLEKRLNVKNIQYECFIFKINGLDSLERQLVQISASGKKWVNPVQTLQLRQRQQKIISSTTSQSNTNNPAMLTQIHENGLLPRPLKLTSSTKQIQYSFIHLPYQKLKYQIQFGVGIKTKGQEVFKRIQANENGKGIIEGLHAATNYRVRMRVQNGNWSQVYEISTLQPQSFSVQSTNFAKSDSKGTITLLRSGTMYANNGYQFGVHSWQCRILVDKTAHHESQTACISLGISNRDNKKAVFVGSTINYGFQRQNLRFKLIVDCDNNRMTIVNQNKQSEETYQNIPDYPVYPTIINKGNSMVQLMITF